MPGNEPLPHLDESGRPTLKTVAALAGVHVSTVSRVLSASYPPERPPAARTTIDRIEVIAREVGFGKNPHAAGLRTSRSHLVGVLVPHLTDIVLSTIYDGIGGQARKLGYQTFVTNTHDEVGLRAEAAEMLLARRVDGLILGDAAVTGDELAADLTRRDVPFVLASRRSDDYPSVTCDDVLGGRMAAEHLLERGHRRVGVLAGTLRASTGLDRTRGFVEAYANAGYEIVDEAIIHSPFDVSSGREAADELLRSRPRITAIFAVNDFTAIGAFGAVRAHGLEAGADVAVVGYNDTPVAAQLPIPMTSVRSPMHDIGVQAMDMLLQRLNGGTPSSRRLTPTLQVRESSSAAAKSDVRAR